MSVLRADFPNLIGGQLGVTVSLSVLHCAVAVLVGVIFLGRGPLDIFQPVVARITVEMSALHPFRTWTHEGNKDQVMDGNLSGPRLRPECYTDVSVSFKEQFEFRPVIRHSPLTRATANLTGPDPSVFGSGVAVKSGDRFQYDIIRHVPSPQKLECVEGRNRVQRTTSAPIILFAQPTSPTPAARDPQPITR